MLLLFDRGTLLLRDPPGGLRPGELPGVLWDPRVGAFRAAARHYEALRAELVRRGVPFSDTVRRPGQPAAPFLPLTLRPYQEAALCAWELARRRGLVALPTGSGKTRVALAAMARSGLTALCLVPTRVLVTQWLRELRAVYPGPLGCYGDGVHELQPVTLCTFESAYRHMAELGDRFDLLVIDEAHHFGQGIRDEALELSVAPARLGLTATLPRDGSARARLEELIGPAVYELGIGDLAGRYLADFDLLTIHLDLGPEERATYETWMAAFHTVRLRFQQMAPGASWQDFACACSRTPAGREALGALRRARQLLGYTEEKRRALGALLEQHRGARVLVFCADNQAAYAIAREHLVMPITCDIGAREREEALGRFQRGELRALVSARVLNEGVDVPDADVAIVVGGTMGEREHVQRIGRLLRPAPGKRARCYELVTRRTLEVRHARRRREGLAARGSSSL